MHTDTVHDRPRRLAGSALVALLALSLAPLAQADHAAPGDGCAVTPGGWGGNPRGHNPAALLASKFDDVFPDGLQVGPYEYLTATQVRAALRTQPTDPLLEHAIALSINLGFGAAGLLEGTIEGVEVTTGPYAGWTSEEVLDEARMALEDPGRTTSKYSSLIDAMSRLNEEREGCNRAPACPTAVTAIAQGDGSIRLTWAPVAGADGYVVYRATSSTGTFVAIGTTTQPTFTDSTTAVGQTYHYRVAAVDGRLESRGCGSVSTTAVPVFPGLLAGGAAVVGSVAAFAWLRRRR